MSETDTSSEHGDTGPLKPSRLSLGLLRPDEDKAGARGMDWELGNLFGGVACTVLPIQ